MNFHNNRARTFVPDGCAPDSALRRITHLGIGAHPDDLEFMAFHGIAACFESANEWFGGVTCTNGAGSVRAGAYANFTDEQMHEIRRREQDAAAAAGRYGAMIQLDYASGGLKNADEDALKKDLKQILAAARPQIVYTHNLADKHDTHIAVAIAAVQAMRELPPEQRPRAVYGCEVWRSLDWLPDGDKIIHDVSGHEKLASSLAAIFDSQISGGKRYDLATLGRLRANATFLDPHATDAAALISFAMDLTPLVADPARDLADYVAAFIAKLEADVKNKLQKYTAR